MPLGQLGDSPKPFPQAERAHRCGGNLPCYSQPCGGQGVWSGGAGRRARARPAGTGRLACRGTRADMRGTATRAHTQADPRTHTAQAALPQDAIFISRKLGMGPGSPARHGLPPPQLPTPCECHGGDKAEGVPHAGARVWGAAAVAGVARAGARGDAAGALCAGDVVGRAAAASGCGGST